VGLRRLPYERLEPLLREHLSTEEDARAAVLSKELRVARRRGYLTQGELEAVCRWKSARAVGHIRANNHHRVRAATHAALETRDERGRLEALLQLKGVSVPMASAVLMLLDPKRYGVIDIRVWQLLYAVGAVSENRRGVHFSPKNWLQFLAIVRDFSSRLRVTVRDIERTLFNVHTAYQEDRLYES
jgi:thermostable 8-oxoguanine DNA glycosylase